MSKEKHRSGLIYALADYKQLVLAYKSKYAELVKRLSFWKTSMLWLLLFFSCIVLFLLFEFSFMKKNIDENKASVAGLNRKLQVLSDQLVDTQGKLLSAQDQLYKKEELIKQLEQNISNASKKLLEKMLKEQ